MVFLDGRHAEAYRHKGVGICALKRASPAGGDGLGHVVDGGRLGGQVFSLLVDAMDAVDMLDGGFGEVRDGE